MISGSFLLSTRDMAANISMGSRRTGFIDAATRLVVWPHLIRLGVGIHTFEDRVKEQNCWFNVNWNKEWEWKRSNKRKREDR